MLSSHNKCKHFQKICIISVILLSIYGVRQSSIFVTKDNLAYTTAKADNLAFNTISNISQVLPDLQPTNDVQKLAHLEATRTSNRQMTTITEARSQHRPCTRMDNIFFLKTHKTAGTSVQNILFRYGQKHHLLFAMPVNKHNFGYPRMFKRNMVFHKQNWNKFNLMTQHIRANYNEVRAVMPPDTFFFSIIREPGAHFESCFDFFRDITESFRRVPPKTTPEYWLKNSQTLFNKTGKYWAFAKNPNTFDFGYDNLNEKKSYVQKTIAEISHRYDLVLIADYYDESMVLLSDALCWPIHDLACLTLNARHQTNLNSDRKATIRAGARKWNKADAALFDHFNDTLWRKIEAYGLERMNRSIAELQRARANITNMCVQGGSKVSMNQVEDDKMRNILFVPKGVEVSAYNLKAEPKNKEFCRYLVLPEPVFTREIFAKQRKLMLLNQTTTTHYKLQ